MNGIVWNHIVPRAKTFEKAQNPRKISFSLTKIERKRMEYNEKLSGTANRNRRYLESKS